MDTATFAATSTLYSLPLRRHVRIVNLFRFEVLFHVVLHLRPNLANQAKQATDKINQEIENLNGISGDVVTALSTIRSAIQHVAEYVTSTAAAVEEQSVVTREMSSSMQRAAAEAATMGAARTV